jgi:hypothetical protein
MADAGATIIDALNVMPTAWARTLMEVVASEGNNTEKCLHHLQGLTVAVAALTGVPWEKLADGLAAHIENFNSHLANAKLEAPDEHLERRCRQ